MTPLMAVTRLVILVQIEISYVQFQVFRVGTVKRGIYVISIKLFNFILMVMSLPILSSLDEQF